MDTSFVSNSVQERDFNQSVISIGSHRDNDIVLSGDGIFPFHATVVQEGEQYRIIPAEVGAQIWVDGNSLRDAFAVFNGSEQIEIGSYVLFFQSNGLPAGIHVIIYAGIDEEAPEDFLKDDTAEAILINVISGEADIEVEQSAFFEFEVVNAGPIVARFTVSLRGAPKDWVEISPSVMNLNEGRRQLVRVRVTPPRDPGSEAGTHTLQVAVTSPNYGRQRATEDLTLTIQPFYEFSLGSLSPRTQRIPWRKRTGITYLPIENRSNTIADFNLMAMDDESGCSFDFLLEEDLHLNRQASFKLQPSEVIEMPIKITPLKNPIFAMRSKQFHYTTNVQIPQQVTVPQAVSGSVKRIPLFGWWSIMLGLATLVLALFFILQPNIRSFDVAAGKDVIELGDSTKLEWDVSPFATRLSLSNVEQPINRGQVSETVAPGQSTTYELTSGNWLSGMFGMDQTEAVTVLVVPPTPEVNVFEVDRTEISKGQMVRVRWSVSEADEVFLTIDEVVFPLSKEEYSGEREVLLEKDALVILEAKNASGSELQSYFVNVVPPYININTFAVWVRPDEAVLNPSASQMVGTLMGGKLFSPTNAPDSTFTVKFVEMVPEPDSETGYRVQFNENVRSELQKGEQVMLEWDVDGAESLQIAPFEDALPIRGSQPFFPQESMNFVMAAASGELESLFMLPVKVFDGEPPEAPTIDFFKASPASMVGAGEVEFSWSVSGEWTRVNLSNADGIVADYLNPVGFQKIKIDESSTLILTAYNGDLSSAKDVQITVDPDLIELPFSVESLYPTVTDFLIGGKVTVNIAYTTPTGQPVPTGEIIVTDGSAICTIALPATSCELTFKTPGTKEITATYTGDTIYLQSVAAPWGTIINVQSVKVSLSAKYFFLNNNLSKGAPISFPAQELTMDQGVYATVIVQPLNSVLFLDGSEKVTVSICDTGQQNCQIGSFKTVRAGVAADGEITTFGYADITIPNFIGAGTYSLIFNYRQDADAIEPETFVEPEVIIKRPRISLAFSGCTPPDSLAAGICEAGISDPNNAELIFDIKNYNDRTNLIPNPLSVNLPAPDAADFSLAWQDAGNSWHDFTCSVKKLNSQYKLVCQYKDATTAIPVGSVPFRYTYNNKTSKNYFMGVDNQSLISENFVIGIQQSTNVQINLSSANFEVGETLILTDNTPANPRAISVYTGTTLVNYNTLAVLTLEEASGNDIFGILSTSTACSLVNKKVVITDLGGDCAVYLKKIGDFQLKAIFEGDPTKSSGESALEPISVVKQVKIGTDWTQVTSPQQINTDFNVKVLLSTPAGITPEALAGRQLVVTFDAAAIGDPKANCRAVSGLDATAVTDEYLTTIVLSAGAAQADFNVRCLSAGKLPLSIRFADAQSSSVDFAFSTIAPVAQTKKTLTINPLSTTTLNYTLTLKPDASNSAYDQNMVAITPSSSRFIHVGEVYEFSFEVPQINGWYDTWYGAYYPEYASQAAYISQFTANDYIRVTFPQIITDNWDTGLSTCDDIPQNTTLRQYRVPLSQSQVTSQYNYSWVDYYNSQTYYYGYFYFRLYGPSCKVVLRRTPSTTVSGPTVDFNYTSNVYSYYTATKNYAFADTGVVKQDVTLGYQSSVNGSVTNIPSTSTVNAIKGEPIDILVNVTPEIAGTKLQPYDSASSPIELSAIIQDANCGTVSSFTRVSATQAKFTYTPDTQGASTTCPSTFTINYNGNTKFNAKTNNFIDVKVEVKPKANADTATTPAATAKTTNVLANDQLGIGSTTITSKTNGTNGTVTCTTTNCTYTPTAGFVGTDSYTYTITDTNANTSTGIVTMTVTAVISPVQDTSITRNATDGGTAITNVVSNDLVNGVAATLGTSGNATIAKVITPTAWPAGINLVTTSGAITVAIGTPPGTYDLEYRLCDRLTPQHCANVTNTVTVDPKVVATADTGVSVNADTGGTAFTNVASNDIVNGLAATLGTSGNATVTKVTTPTAWPTGIDLTATGAITVAPATPHGSYNVTYRLCDKLTPQTCATRQVTVTVTAVALAVDDAFSGVAANAGTAGNVLGVSPNQDKVDGVTATLGTSGNATVATATWNAAFTLDTATGVITFDNTLATGSYNLTYTLCVKSTTACNTGAVTVTVP